jgi:bacteriorhodopsin
MVRNFSKIKNLTPYRYIDWMITTPVMLITLMAYLEKDPRQTLEKFIDSNKNFLGTVVALNLLMLMFGLLGELGLIEYNTAIVLGFIPFIYYFKMLYDRYMTVPIPSDDRRNLFWFFAVVWSLYGVVAFLPYTSKNVSYNVLDLVSKNLFGVFLVYVLWSNRVG